MESIADSGVNCDGTSSLLLWTLLETTRSTPYRLMFSHLNVFFNAQKHANEASSIKLCHIFVQPISNNHKHSLFMQNDWWRGIYLIRCAYASLNMNIEYVASGGVGTEGGGAVSCTVCEYIYPISMDTHTACFELFLPIISVKSIPFMKQVAVCSNCITQCKIKNLNRHDANS